VTISTFDPPQAPSQDGFSAKVTARLLTTNFGDGYVQRTPDGINYIGRTVSLSWTAITGTLWAPIQEFFDTNIGGIPFLYQVPGDSVVRQWTLTGYTLGTFDGANYYGNGVQLTLDYTPTNALPSGGSGSSGGGGTTGTEFVIPYIVSGLPGSGQQIDVIIPFNFTIAANLVGSAGYSGVAPAEPSEWVLSAIASGVETAIATISWSGTFATYSSGAYSGAANTVLSMLCPTPADVDQANISFSLVILSA